MAEKIIIVQGKPGSGKSSCCKDFLHNNAGFPFRHLSVGQRFRELLQDEKYTATHPGMLDQAGVAIDYRLPRYDLVYKVMIDFVSEVVEPGFSFIDGFPKEPEMLPLLDRDISGGLLEVAGIIVVDISDELSLFRQVQRASSTSVDVERYDAQKALDRIAEYNILTKAVIGSLSVKYPTAYIDGSLPLPEVSQSFGVQANIFMST